MYKKIENALVKMSVTKWNYWFSFIYDAAMSIILVTIGFLYGVDLLMAGVTFVAGFFFFTLVEYFAHAKLFHGWVKSLTAGHAKHHRNPMGYDAMPFFFAMFIIAPFGAASYLFLTFEYTMVFTGGIFLGYIAYGLMHHLMHRANFKNSYFQYMKKFHDLHHEQPKMNHGVTVPFWDIVFGTFLSTKKSA